MALTELSFADHARLKKSGRSFDCQNCPKSIQSLRRCQEDREDFTEADGSLWPMYIEKGGDLFSFCPGKATWDHEAVGLFRLLVVSAETGKLYESGGLSDQPDWWIETLSWFIPRYKTHEFINRAKMILGDEKSNAK